jgi:hypothetical protein
MKGLNMVFVFVALVVILGPILYIEAGKQLDRLAEKGLRPSANFRAGFASIYALIFGPGQSA